MSGLRVLTFNFHEPYLCLMAKTGLDFTIGTYRSGPLARAWHGHYRAVPANMRFADESDWRRDMEAGRFDVAIAHNEANASDIIKYDVPLLLVCHNRRTFLRTTTTPDKIPLFDQLLDRLKERFHFVFISESKRADYGIPGTVILPGIDVEEYGGYTGKIAEVLRVGNMMRARDLMFDVGLQEEVCEGLPNQVAGLDPTIPNAREAGSFHHLLRLYRSRRCLLHITREAFEDGYNLAMLEAMACGMPVVSLSNKTSPITDGVDGFTGDNAHTLRARVMELLQDVDLAQTIGARGRETVADKFPIKAFVDKWRAVIEEAAAGKPNSQKRVPSHAGRNILLHYAATPITTGRYFETAARKHHRVVTAGFRCPEEVLQVWGFTRPYPSYAPQQIDLPLRDTGDEIIKNLPGDFTPDLFLWIDSGAETAPAGLDKLSCPKACFLIDTHIDPGLRLPIARLFDFTFLAQKAQVSLFEGEGIKNVHWLPLACSPELHNLPQPARDIDVAFVGSLTNRSNQRRARLLAEVKRRFPDACIAQLWPDEMANTYARSKIVLNISVKRDVNMRVFEAMASGAMLVTDDADGLADLFEEGRHLAVYHNDDDACDIIEKYLRDDAGRAAIADAGQRLVLSKHTYERRVAEIVSVMEEGGALKMETQPAAMNMFYYQSVRPEVLQFVPVSARRVLDVGCGCGAFGGALKQMGVPEVHGIELVEAPCAEARKILDSATCGNIEQMDMAFGDGYFDCITFNDVLEHLVNPAGALRKAARCLADHGVIMASLPNVRFFQVVGMLANGRWEYTDAGILDRTHLRFFTAREMEGLVRDAGLELLEIRPLSMLLPEQAPLNSDGSLDMGCMTIQPLDEKDRDDLLTYQYLIVAGKTGVDRLEPARAAIEQGAYGTAYAYALDARAVNAMERKRIMAKSAAHIGRMPEAEKLYRELVDSDPRDGVAVGELGILLVAMNRLDEARPLLECAGLQDPANDKITGALGLLFAAQGDHAQAFVHLREALEASREHHGLLGPFIGVAESVGRLADAETVAAQYADFLPANETVVMLYAELLITLGRPREAVDRIDAFLAFNPDSVAARSLLAAAKKAAQS